MRYFLSTLIASSIFTTAATQTHAIDKPPSWTPEYMMQTKVVSDVQLSPDNESVLFVAIEAKMSDEKGVLLSRIYKKNLKDEDATPFSAPDISSMQPRWSPDGKWIAFLSNCDDVKNLYLIHSEGGEPLALTTSKKSVQTFNWSPDSKKIALVIADETETEKNREKLSLAYVYKQPRLVNRLWLIDTSTDYSLKPLTPDDYCVRGGGDLGTTNAEFDWSPDSTKITFAYSPSVGFDDFHLDSSIATIDLNTGLISPWEKHAPYEALPRYSPNGQLIAYISNSSPHRYSLDRQVAIRNSEGKEPNLLAPTFNEGAFLAGPHLLGWTKDSENLFFYEPKGTKFHLMLLPIDGKPAKAVDHGPLFFKSPTLSQDKSMLGFVAQTTATPPEACITKLDDFKITQISSVNKPLLAYPKIRTEVVNWATQDGMNIEGLLTYPLNYEQNKQYPLLVVVHGGPMGFFDESFVGIPNPYPIAPFAEKGFCILRPNPRGSCGYGKSFRCANYNDWGGADFLDIMAGIDSLIAKGLVDSERLGIMGWSYGGYMTAWAITQTARFKAASMEAGICNLLSMSGTTDLHRLLSDYFGSFVGNREMYEQRSPINYVSNVQTPCMIQHGTADLRVPTSQSYEFYHALDRLGKEATLVLYPEMGHVLSDPKMLRDAMEQNLAWFQKYLN